MNGIRKYAFWIAVLLSGLGALSAFANPVVGLAYALVYFAVARGIRRNQFWAATAGAGFTGLPVVVVLLRSGEWQSATGPGRIGIMVSIVFQLLCATVFVSAAAGLKRFEANGAMRSVWIALMAATACFWLCLRPYAIPTGAMENTLLTGDLILVETVTPQFGINPHRGEIVVIHYPVDPKQTFTKRIVGMPGDRLRIVNKALYVNGAAVREPYAIHKMDYIDAYRDNFPSTPGVALFPQATRMLDQNVRNGEVVVPTDRYFVLGDNRDQSLDSRYWGFVSRADVIGEPVLIYGSNERGDNPDSPGPEIRWTVLWEHLR